jgi:hypothetical protein
MTDAGGSWAGAAAGWANVALQAAAMAASGVGTGMRIEEAITDYSHEASNIEAQQAEISGEGGRKAAVAREEGVMALQEQGAQAAYETKLATVKTELVTSSEEAKLGKSGVRIGGSPLLAAQQNVNLAAAAADRTAESGMAGMALGGVKLKNQLGDITANQTLLTAEYERRRQEALRQQRYLEQNKGAMIGVAVAGGAPGLGTSFYNAGKASGWWQ